MAKAPARSKAMAAKANEPEPAVMAAGASLENKVEGKGTPPAEPPTSADKEAKAEEQARDSGGEESSANVSGEGFRDDVGRFTGNPPTDSERLDAICDLLEKNGMSLPKVLHRAKE